MDPFFATWSPRSWNLNVNNIIPEWNSLSAFAVMIFIISAIASFVISFRCYSSTDETPIGFKLLFSILASMWNVLYLVYYFMTVHVIGLECGS
jgi:hypothetical protein